MPKRSLHSGNGDQKKFEQLNKSIDAMLARNDGKVDKATSEIEPLVRIAAELRNLPNANFKARLKSELEGKKLMASVAEPISTTRIKASPRIAFRDAAKAIDFYKQAFGAQERFRFEHGGHIAQAELAIGDSTLMVTEEWPEGNRFSAETLGNSPILFVIEVPDVDSFSKHAIGAGMKVVRPLKNQFYGHRDITLADPFNYLWTIFSVTEEMSLDEMHRRMPGTSQAQEGDVTDEPAQTVAKPPRGLRMVTPYLVAADGPALLDFTKRAFGAEEVMRAVTPTGVHGEMRLGDSMLMMGGGVPGKEFPGKLQRHALHIYVEDADKTFRTAIAAGATVIDEVRQQEYGERSATVKDPAGNIWYIATAEGASYQPQGLHSVNPYLHPLRAEPFISFLKRAFNAEEVAKYASPDGVVHHAQVRIGDSVLEMGEAHDKYEPMPSMFYLYVPNVDDAYRRAVAAGATSFQEPTDQPYGDRNAGVRDAFGNTWYVATHIKDVNPS